MISIVDPTLRFVAEQLHAVQQAAYTLESELIDYPAFPLLFETVEDIQHSPETFLAYMEEGCICGALSFTASSTTVDIGCLVVAPPTCVEASHVHSFVWSSTMLLYTDALQSQLPRRTYPR